MTAWGVPGLVLLCGCVTLWAQEGGGSTEQRMRALEQRSEQVEKLIDHVHQLEGQVTDLKQDLDTLSQAQPQPANRSAYGSGGPEIGYWLWLSHLYDKTGNTSSQTFWAWEVEIDVTHAFSERVSAGFDLDFTDRRSGGARVNVEQAFLSLLVSQEHQTILTMGKFNSPFGVEARDFWDWLAGSSSLHFKAQPRDLTGLMLTQRIAETGVKVRSVLVNGFDLNLDNNAQPTIGAMIEYAPSHNVSLAVTNWYGPEGSTENGEQMYLVIAKATIHLTQQLVIDLQYVNGDNQLNSGDQKWDGYLLQANYDLSDQWRVYGRWSYIDDEGGFVTGVDQQTQEVSGGMGFYLTHDIEFRVEYRHDFRRTLPDIDSVQTHVTFRF